MIVPDINLLIYAYNSDSPFHLKAKAWWQGCMTGTEQVLLPQVVALGFVRVGTNARAFGRPLTVTEAASLVRSWLAQEVVVIPEIVPHHLERVLELLASLGTAGNLVTDAQIAALAMEHDAVVHTADADFIRFKGLRWLNPITGDASAGQRRSRS
jgi:toxin-antitoxin system PIN domain toxin